jgi:hypothetical protein
MYPQMIERAMAADLPHLVQSEERARSPFSTCSEMVGDWLLTFPKEVSAPPSRLTTTPWRMNGQGEEWRLWQSSPADGWKGAPTLLVETPEWSARLTGELYGTSRPVEAVIDLLAGRAPAEALNGHFLLAAWNRQANEWHVWTNRHATLHAYLATGGARTALGTFMPAVAAAVGASTLDWEGLTGFFGFGFLPTDRTHLDGVRILRPATHYVFNARGHLATEERYWNWRYAPDYARSYDDTVAEFAERLAAVMADLTAAGRIAVPISGGLDSRSTVAALASRAAPSDRLWAYSYGYGADSAETKIARRVAAARGLPFDAYAIGAYLFDRLPGVLAAVEGFEDVTQCRQAAVVGDIAPRADHLIAAHLGDLYLNDVGLGDALGTTDDEFLIDFTLKKIRKGGSAWLLEHLCHPRLGSKAPEAVLREQVAGELARLEEIVEPDFRIKAFKVDQWCARWTTVSLRMFQAAAFPRLPFYDTRLADFFATTPTPYLSGRRLQIDYLKRYAPDLARIPWQATGRDLFHDRSPSPLDFARRATRAARRLLGRQTIERNWEVQFMTRHGRDALQRWLLRPGLLLHEFVAPQAIQALLRAFDRDPYTEKRGSTVAMLLTFSAWLELQYREIAPR